MEPGDVTSPAGRRFQFDLRTLLAVTAMVAIAATMITHTGPFELLLLGAVGIPILVVVVCAWNRSSWRVGVVLLMAVSVAATPADPASMLLLAVPLCGLYVLGVLVWKVMQRRKACSK